MKNENQPKPLYNIYKCVNARFLFFNGINTYTVEYTYALSMWFIFNNTEISNCIFSKKVIPKKSKSPNRNEAEIILIEYLG